MAPVKENCIFSTMTILKKLKLLISLNLKPSELFYLIGYLCLCSSRGTTLKRFYVNSTILIIPQIVISIILRLSKLRLLRETFLGPDKLSNVLTPPPGKRDSPFRYWLSATSTKYLILTSYV